MKVLTQIRLPYNLEKGRQRPIGDQFLWKAKLFKHFLDPIEFSDSIRAVRVAADNDMDARFSASLSDLTTNFDMLGKIETVLVDFDHFARFLCHGKHLVNVKAQSCTPGMAYDVNAGSAQNAAVHFRVLRKG